MVVTAKEAGPPVRPIAVAQLRNDVEGKATVDTLRRALGVVKRDPEVQLASGARKFESRPKYSFLEQVEEGVFGFKFGLIALLNVQALVCIKARLVGCWVRVPDHREC